ncbi:MAG: N-acetylmuramoyl-L-alanine amidase [Desulfopila sp.]
MLEIVPYLPYLKKSAPDAWLIRLCLMLLCLLLACAPANAEEGALSSAFSHLLPENTSAQRFNEAKFYYNELLTNSALGADKQNWLRGARNFRRVYLDEPRSDQAPACLFMLGQLHYHKYQRFHQNSDLQESINYYQDITRLFPKHALADDSWYALGQISLKVQHDPAAAARHFARIIQDYPGGDMHPEAAELMKQLSKDHNVELPPVMVGSSPLSKLNYILPVQYWSSKDYTRIVIRASGPVKYHEELLQRSARKPQRLYIDVQDSYIEPQYRQPLVIGDGLLRQVRTAQFSKDTVRVVLDIDSIDTYRIYSLPEPFRVIVDVRGKNGESDTHKRIARLQPVETSKPGVSETTTSQTPLQIERDKRKILASQQEKRRVTARHHKVVTASAEQAGPSLAQQLGLKIGRIVLDPGHGGKDPGAMANGLKEKDIVLKFAQQLKPLLEKETGCEVLLTRNSDTFVSLEERTAIANTHNADIFISLHLNAHPSPQVRGLETYYLNLSTNAEAMRVAAMENATSTNQMSDLQDILKDILQNSKIAESSRLASQVHDALVKGLSEQTNGTIPNLGIKQAPFYVLIGAQMPSILIELAFISNKEDMEKLQSTPFSTVMAKELTAGIEAYVNRSTARL